MVEPQRWKFYVISILGRFDTYEGARNLEVTLENSSSSEKECGRGRRKKKIKRKFSDSDTTLTDESDHQENIIVKRTPNMSKSKYYKVDVGDPHTKQNMDIIINEFLSSSGNRYMDLRDKNQLNKLIEKHTQNADITKSIDNDMNDNGNEQVTETCILNAGQTMPTNSEAIELRKQNTERSAVESNEMNSEPAYDNNPILVQILENVISIKYEIRKIKEELQHLNSSHSSTLDQAALTNMNKYIPVKTIDEIKQLEEMLSQEEHANHLKHILIKVGGRDAKDFTFRCLARLFTNTVGIKCAWTKLKNNFELQNLKIISILRDAAEMSFSEYKDHLFKRYTQDWFRHCAQRVKRNSI